MYCFNPLWSTLTLCSSSASCIVPTWALPFPYRNMAAAPFPIMLCLHLTHQTVAVPAARAPAQITTRQLIELFFSSQAGGHCKNIPTLEYGFLVQVRHKGDMRLLNKALTHPVLLRVISLVQKHDKQLPVPVRKNHNGPPYNLFQCEGSVVWAIYLEDSVNAASGLWQKVGPTVYCCARAS